jgi:hypothetical protein
MVKSKIQNQRRAKQGYDFLCTDGDTRVHRCLMVLFCWHEGHHTVSSLKVHYHCFCVHWISCGFVFLNMTFVVKIVLW